MTDRFNMFRTDSAHPDKHVPSGAARTPHCEIDLVMLEESRCGRCQQYDPSHYCAHRR